MNINPINFKGIYHHQIDARKNPREFQGLLLAKSLEEEAKAKLVVEHQNIGIISSTLEAYEKSPYKEYDLSWLIRHGQSAGIELPKFLTDGIYDVYVLTDKDKEDYEKGLEKRAEEKNALRISRKISKKANKIMGKEASAEDVLLKEISLFAQNEQQKFQEFLKKRILEPLNVQFSKDGSVKIKLDKSQQ